jgi:hypothetical protein
MKKFILALVIIATLILQYEYAFGKDATPG